MLYVICYIYIYRISFIDVYWWLLFSPVCLTKTVFALPQQFHVASSGQWRREPICHPPTTLAEHDDWKAMGWISSRFHSFISLFFFEIPQGCNVWIKRQNGKPKKKNVPCLFEGFRSLIGFHHFCWIFWFPSHPCIVKPFAEFKSNWIISPKNRCKTFKIFEPNTFKFGLTDIHLMPVLPCLLKIASQDTQSWHRRNCNNWRSKCSSVPPCRSCQGWNLAYADNLGSPEGGLINRVDGRGAMIPWSPVQNELCCRQNWREVGQLG